MLRRVRGGQLACIDTDKCQRAQARRDAIERQKKRQQAANKQLSLLENPDG